MPQTDDEFAAIMEDATKRIGDDVTWGEDEDHSPAREFRVGVGAMFTCSEHGDYQRIRTPYLYPDGDNIDLFCKVEGGAVTVSDLAETTGWLRMQSTAARRSPKQRRLIEDACVTHGVEFYRGMLQARCRPGDELAQVVTRVAQAALRVSDLWFTFRTQSVQSVADEVADFLTEREFGFERAPEAGRTVGTGLDGRFPRPHPVPQLSGPGAEHRDQCGSARRLRARAGVLA